MKITFVCAGNTCRSPMLMYMFRDYAKKVGFECETDSAGLMDGGSPVNPNTVAVLKSRGIDAANYVSKTFDDALAAQSDYVFAMTDALRDALLEKYPSCNVRSLSEVAGTEIADPYGMELAAYEAVGDAFEGMLDAVLSSVTDKEV